MDLTLRLPAGYKEKEMEVRNELSRLIERGKSEVVISLDSREAVRKTVVNVPLVQAYYEELKKIDKDLKLNTPNFLQLILSLPEVLSTDRSIIDEEEWETVMQTIRKADEQFQNFRKAEGKTLSKDLEARIHSIQDGLNELGQYEGRRIDIVRKRLQGNLEEFIQVNNIDRNRLEQELIFYIEKLDISEEKVRLASHCDYFMKTMKSDSSSGKKLSFIAQEIGREINTIGSKANDADMQKAVVVMKDQLEKIKEQVLNIL